MAEMTTPEKKYVDTLSYLLFESKEHEKDSAEYRSIKDRVLQSIENTSSLIKSLNNQNLADVIEEIKGLFSLTTQQERYLREIFKGKWAGKLTIDQIEESLNRTRYLTENTRNSYFAKKHEGAEVELVTFGRVREECEERGEASYI